MVMSTASRKGTTGRLSELLDASRGAEQDGPKATSPPPLQRGWAQQPAAFATGRTCSVAAPHSGACSVSSYFASRLVFDEDGTVHCRFRCRPAADLFAAVPDNERELLDAGHELCPVVTGAPHWRCTLATPRSRRRSPRWPEKLCDTPGVELAVSPQVLAAADGSGPGTGHEDRERHAS
jgi:hypothetical protein